MRHGKVKRVQAFASLVMIVFMGLEDLLTVKTVKYDITRLINEAAILIANAEHPGNWSQLEI